MNQENENNSNFQNLRIKSGGPGERQNSQKK